MFKTLVDRFNVNSSDSDFHKLINYTERNNISPDEIGYLATKLADSGEKISVEGFSADIPSTGGPSSLSTLICPLILCEIGFKVVKLGVSGRPAGGVDVLAQIPGYKINFNKHQIENLLSKHDYIHFIASENFAPLDRILFDFRKRTNKINISALAIASLLSKKLVCGLTHTGLDIRVSRFGNFGRTFQEAIRNGQLFKEIAESLGIRVAYFVSNSNYAYQPYIGRGESLVALYKILYEDISSELLLREHLNYCLLMSLSMGNGVSTDDVIGIIKRNFIKNLTAQSASESNFKKRVNEILERKSFYVKSQETGFFDYNLEMIRDEITGIQKQFISNSKLFPDPCGVILLANHGDYVHKGECIAQVRFDSKMVNENILRDSFRGVFKTSIRMKQGKNFIVNHGW